MSFFIQNAKAVNKWGNYTPMKLENKFDFYKTIFL